MDYTKDFGVMISDEDYDHHMNLVKKMPPKKRNQYKGSLTDKWGQRSKLIFRDGDLWNYCLFYKKIVRVEPMRVIFQMARSEDATIADVSNAGL